MDLTPQVSRQLLLVDGFVRVERDIRCACPRTSSLSQSRRDVFFLGDESPFADAPFAEPVAML